MFIIPEFGSTDLKSIETYSGSVMTTRDALILLEATRIGMIPRVKRRLNGLERKYIRPNSVFAWNETECGMKRWTDGKNWSPSKVSGPFLIYRELDENKSIKPNSLIKQSFSVITKQNQKLHLISYYQPGSQNKSSTPSSNPNFSSIRLTLQVYPDHLLETKEQEVHHSPEPLMVNSTYTSPNIHMPYFNQYTMQYNPHAHVPAPVTATIPAPFAHYTSTPHPIASAYPGPPHLLHHLILSTYLRIHIHRQLIHNLLLFSSLISLMGWVIHQ